MDNIPLNESYTSLVQYESKRSLTGLEKHPIQRRKKRRVKRSFLYYTPVNITERISAELLQSLIDNIGFQHNYGMCNSI